MFKNLRNMKLKLASSIFKEISQNYTGLRNNEFNLTSLDQKASILLHHDAITSTSPDATINDYRNMISRVNE